MLKVLLLQLLTDNIASVKQQDDKDNYVIPVRVQIQRG